MRNKSLLVLVLLLITLQSYAQDTLLISQATITEKIQSGNTQLLIKQQEYEAAKGDHQQSNAVWLPSVSVSHTAMFTTNPLMAFGSKLNQEILTQSDFNPALLNDPDQTKNFATKIEVLQPIINVDGMYGRQAAKAKMDAFALQAERTQEYLEFEAVKAYMQLQLAYKAVAVLEEAQQTVNANLKLINDYNNQGLVQVTDVLSVKVRAKEVQNQLQYAKSNVQNASDYLSYLMGEATNVIYKPETMIEGTVTFFDANTSLSENRKDIQAMDLSTEAYKSMMKSGKTGMLPRLNAFGSYELYDDHLFQTGAQGYTVGAQLSWDVFDGYKTLGKSKKAKAEYEKAVLETEAYKAKSQLELNKVNRQLQDAENQVQLAKQSWEESTEAYRILHNRFEEGLEKTTDLLHTETQMIQKELAYLQAVFEYNTTKAYIQFLTK